MKSRTSKIIIMIVLGIILIFPTIASAAPRTSVQGGLRNMPGSNDGNYAWAHKDYTTVWARVMDSSYDTGKVGGWCDACTKPVYGVVTHYGYGVVGSSTDYYWN